MKARARVERPRSVSLSAIVERRRSSSTKLASPAVPSNLTDDDVNVLFKEFLVCLSFLLFSGKRRSNHSLVRYEWRFLMFPEKV
jgi:hypothetical protein